MRLLLIDNYDSFTFNLYHQIVRLTSLPLDVISYNIFSDEQITAYDGFIISPGPGNPHQYPLYGAVLDSGRPVFGVCLGMQIINQHFGGAFGRLEGCRHGVVRRIDYRGSFYEAAVYNSLYCSSVPDVLEITAEWEGIPMAVRHRSLPVAGVQFHPESFLTKDGDTIIKDVFSSIGIL